MFMGIRSFASLAGLVYLVIGIFGFLPSLTHAPPVEAPHVAFERNYSYLFGLFPINLLHNVFHIVIGAWGLLASSSVDASRTFACSIAVLYGMLTLMGLFPGLNTAFGLLPLFGHAVWLHAGTALVAAYFGFAASSEVKRVRRPGVKSERVKVYEERPQS